MLQVTPPRVGQHGVADQAAASTPTRVGHPGVDNAAPPVLMAELVHQPMASTAYAGEISSSSVDLAPRHSAQGRKRPWTPLLDSEVTELELLRRNRGSSIDDEGHNAQPLSVDVSLLAQLEWNVQS